MSFTPEPASKEPSSTPANATPDTGPQHKAPTRRKVDPPVQELLQTLNEYAVKFHNDCFTLFESPTLENAILALERAFTLRRSTLGLINSGTALDDVKEKYEKLQEEMEAIGDMLNTLLKRVALDSKKRQLHNKLETLIAIVRSTETACRRLFNSV